MQLFTTASIDIANAQPNLSPEALEHFLLTLGQALESAAHDALTDCGIAQTMQPTIIVQPFYQAGDEPVQATD